MFKVDFRLRRQTPTTAPFLPGAFTWAWWAVGDSENCSGVFEVSQPGA